MPFDVRQRHLVVAGQEVEAGDGANDAPVTDSSVPVTRWARSSGERVLQAIRQGSRSFARCQMRPRTSRSDDPLVGEAIVDFLTLVRAFKRNLT
jgi:hypothetical protein